MIASLLFGVLSAGGAALCVGHKKYGWATWFGLLSIAEFIVMGAAMARC